MNPPYARELATIVDVAAESLLGMSDDDASKRPAPGKWSAKEIIGHLIDSASINHQRFVRAQWQNDLIFAGYAQDDWVKAQNYQSAPWEELVGLWHAYNLQMARVMQATPDAIRTRPHLLHNLHKIAMNPIPASEPATLDHLMSDYVEHVKHHLAQISAMASR